VLIYFATENSVKIPAGFFFLHWNTSSLPRSNHSDG